MTFFETDKFRMKSYPTVGAVFSPSDLDGLVLWLDANDSSTLWDDSGGTDPAVIGDTIGLWEDKSSQGNDVSQGTDTAQPTLTGNELNGKQTLWFDGGDVLNKTSATGLDAMANFTMWIVLNRHFTSGNRDPFYLDSGADIVYRMRWVSANSIVAWLTTADSSVSGSRSWGTQSVYAVRKASYDGSNQRWYFGGANDTDALTGNVITVTTPTLRIGDSPGASAHSGGIAEIIFYNRLLSGVEQTQVEDYFLEKWGINQ